jgi:uncharacterized protein
VESSHVQTTRHRCKPDPGRNTTHFDLEDNIMPVTPTYPGVYIEEIPSGVRTITGVATSVAAFIDFFKQGPTNEPVQLFSMADFEREFGGLDPQSEASYAIQQFFLNGGGEAWVVRVASDSLDGTNVPNRAAVYIDDAPLATLPGTAAEAANAAVLIVSAANEGKWGNHLRVQVDYDTLQAGEFNLLVSEYVTIGSRTTVARNEVFRNLSMVAGQTNFAETVINDPDSGSRLIQVEVRGTTPPAPPLINGTLSGEHTADPTIPAAPRMIVSLANGAATTTSGPLPLAIAPGAQPLTAIAPALQAAIRAAYPANPAFSGAQVEVLGNRLHVRTGPGDPRNRLGFQSVPANEVADNLRLTTDAAVRTSTLSGVHTDEPEIPIGPEVEVTIGGTTQIASLSFPPEIALPVQVPLAQIAPVLEEAIQGASGGVAFTGARVVVQGDRLIVMSGGAAPGSEVTFAAGGTADALLLSAAVVRQATLSGEHTENPTVPIAPTVQVTIGDTGVTVILPLPLSTVLPADLPLDEIAPVLQGAIRAARPENPAFADATVAVLDDRLFILPGAANPGGEVGFATAGGSDVADDLRLTAAAGVNVQEYTLGQNAIANTAQIFAVAGSAGLPPDATALIGSESDKTGIYALENVDLFTLLCIPRIADLAPEQAQAVTAVAQAYCERRRAFFLMDTPREIDEPREIRNWLSANNGLRHRNAALFFPRLRIPDPLNEFRLRSVGASGTMAGLFARTDSTRGVWKAPAGTEATLRNVPDLEYVLSDPENGALNPLAINCLRNFPVYGTVSWGSRTLEGSDQQASEWKYIPVRRLALFLEESLYRGTKWVVFEPNDEPLWSQIRLGIGGFMHTLFRQGAFQGRSPREAYLVKCDSETTTQEDINRGIVNILVGFAPLKPAEFVIIRIQQLAGQVEA